MSDNEQPVELPGGGKAWVAKVLTHAQDQIITRHYLRRRRFEVEEPIPGSDEMRRVERSDLTPEQIEELIDLESGFRDVYIRARVLRWEDVTDPEGNPIAFPEDVGRMRTDDFNALFVAIGAVARGDNLPNSEGPSASTSTRGSHPKTP